MICGGPSPDSADIRSMHVKRGRQPNWSDQQFPSIQRAESGSKKARVDIQVVSTKDSFAKKSSTSCASTPPSVVPHAALRKGLFEIDGKPTYLFGGDLHYFRVRDANSDPKVTYKMWAQTLDQMKDAGMNLVSTYVPWDYHNPASGDYDFEGAKDIKVFLDMVQERGMHAVLKPGPLITGEWPNGFGTFGAVPSWFKDANPDAMERNSDGKFFEFGPFAFLPGDKPHNRQPTFLNKEYLSAVDNWYQRFTQEVSPFLGNTVVAVQIDNETNQYWSHRFGDVGYAPESLDFTRQWLSEKYQGDIGRLNESWNSSYESFDDVIPIGRLPKNRDENSAAFDWYQAGHAYVREYLETLKQSLISSGVKESDVVFMTNDAPFGINMGEKFLFNVLIADAKKHSVAPTGMDLYPKLNGSSDTPQDRPFQADYFTKLSAHRGEALDENGGYCYGAELQGGLYSAFYGLLKMVVPPESTDQLLARSVGHGMKGGSVYVIRDGLNADNSNYDYQAAISRNGAKTERYEVLKKWGDFLKTNGTDLLESKEVQNKVAVLVDGLDVAPKGEFADDQQRIQTVENPALYGWLKSSGINAEVFDTQTVSKEQLQSMNAVFFLNPDNISPDTKKKLADFTDGGGTLVNLLWNDLEEAAPKKHDWAWLGGFSGRGEISVEAGEYNGPVPARGYESFADELPASAKPFAWEKKWPFGERGRVVGYVDQKEQGKVVQLGTNVFGQFNRSDYYSSKAEEGISEAIQLGRWLAKQGGEEPIVSSSKPRELVWARKSENKLYLFCINDNAKNAVMNISVHDAQKLGLEPEHNYFVRDALNHTSYGAFTGRELAEKPLRIAAKKFGSTVLMIEPNKSEFKEDADV